MRTIDTAAYLDTACRLLEEGSHLVPVPVAGTSMCPFLHPGDTVYLELPPERAAVGDILLFRRPGGSYILHRVVGIQADGVLWLLGDSQLVKEPVHPTWVRARVVQAKRKGKLIGPGDRQWQLYQSLWLRLLPVRKPILAVHKFLKTGK